LLVHAYLSRDDLKTASEFAKTADELQHLAAELFRAGQDEDAFNVLLRAADADQSNVAVRAELAKRFVARGDMERARNLLTPDVAGNDPELLWLLAEMELRDGRIPEGTLLLQRMLVDDPTRRDALVILSCRAERIRQQSSKSHPCPDAAGRDLRGRRVGSNDAHRSGAPR
jgi:predicted Zn-dependent protease